MLRNMLRPSSIQKYSKYTKLLSCHTLQAALSQLDERREDDALYPNQSFPVGGGLPKVFAPTVTATCRSGLMTVKVETAANFAGVVQSRDSIQRTCNCIEEIFINIISKFRDMLIPLGHLFCVATLKGY